MGDYTLTQHRGKLALTYRVGGSTRRISTGTADRGHAEAVAQQLWTRITAPPTERISDLWPRYVADRIKDGARPDRFKSHWTALSPVFGHRLGTAITKDDCREYATGQRAAGYSASTVRTDLELLRACLRWRFGDAAPAIWVSPASAPRDRWLTKDEARRIVAAARSPHIRLFLVLGLATGARAGAILDLTWDRVDMVHGTIDYRPAGREQTNKRRTVVPMNGNARAALLEAREAALTDHVIEYAGQPVASVKKAVGRLGISPHVLRHTCAVWMAQADVPMQKISQYLGHTSLAVTTRVYARYQPSFMADAGVAVEF